MAFFSDGQNRTKLLMLYILKCFRTPVTREQLFTLQCEVDGTDYFTACQLLAELEEEHYLITVPVRQQQLMSLTDKGLALLDAFSKEIARSVRDEVKGLADERRDAVRRQNCITADAEPRPDGTWSLNLALTEGGSTVFEMTLRMPDAATAQRALLKWLEGADSIYPEFYTRLAE